MPTPLPEGCACQARGSRQSGRETALVGSGQLQLSPHVTERCPMSGLSWAQSSGERLGGSHDLPPGDFHPPSSASAPSPSLPPGALTAVGAWRWGAGGRGAALGNPSGHGFSLQISGSPCSPSSPLRSPGTTFFLTVREAESLRSALQRVPCLVLVWPEVAADTRLRTPTRVLRAPGCSRPAGLRGTKPGAEHRSMGPTRALPRPMCAGGGGGEGWSGGGQQASPLNSPQAQSPMAAWWSGLCSGEEDQGFE